MNQPNGHLNSVLQPVSIPDGFVERKKFRLDSPATASRTYFADKQILTLQLYLYEDSKKCFGSLEDDIQRARIASNDSSSTPHRKLSSYADVALLWNQNGRKWHAVAICRQWLCRVEVEYKHYTHNDSSRGTAKALIAVLCTGLPVEEKEHTENLVSGDASNYCKWLVPLYLNTKLSQLSAEKFTHLAEATGINKGKLSPIIFNPTEVTFLNEYQQVIKAAANETRLAPELIGAVILSEMRGLDTFAFTWESIKELTVINDPESWTHWLGKWAFWLAGGVLFTWPLTPFILHVQKKFGFDERWRDQMLSIISDDVSMGIVQRQVNSIIRLGVHEGIAELSGLSAADLRKTIRLWLIDDKKAIRLIAHYLRCMANQAAKYSGPRENKLKEWVEKKACGTFDLGRFALQGDQWTPAHINFIGWKYNTGHLDDLDDITGISIWGDMFSLSYRDILKSGILKTSV